jgi:hypothetical protein
VDYLENRIVSNTFCMFFWEERVPYTTEIDVFIYLFIHLFTKIESSARKV